MDYSSLTLKNNTLSRVNMLLERDFETFKIVKPLGLLEETKKSFKKFLAKKSLYYITLFAAAMILPSIETSVAAAELGEQKTFITTAYYSPLPNQEKYYRGSYEADITLNGKGIQASDGTPVFVGMIAAPKGYSFGTKISLDGLGVVSVHDRGGAINEGQGYDRIDIWMGYGDEGLKRTLEWGRREITGTIVSHDTPVSLDLVNIVKNAPKITQVALKKLQAIGYNTTGKTFKEIILQFQLDHNIISSPHEAGAGNYGPKTTAKLNELYNNRNNIINNSNKAVEEIVVYTDSVTKMTEAEARTLAQNMKLPSLGHNAIGVTNLQKFLQNQGLYNDEIHGTMTLGTLGALKKYQHSKNIIQTGRTDIKTQQYIIADLMK